MAGKYEKLIKEAKTSRGFNLKEFLTRSEGPELFTTVLNDKLLEGLQPELPDPAMQLFDEVPLERGSEIRFPSIRGVNPDLVPELGEYQRADWEITAVTVEPQKFGMLLGLSREMIQESMMGIIGRNVRMVGSAHRDLRRREHMKCISVYSTGPVVATAIVGLTDHGYRYPTLGYTNFFSGTAMSWEARFSNAITMLMNQRITITAKGIDVPFPVKPNFVLANPHHMKDIQKVLNASITVVSIGISTGSTPNVAGTNVFQGALQTQIYDPEIPTGQCLVGLAKRGLVTVTKYGLELDEFQNFYFDAEDLKSREKFLPAVIEERFVCDIQITG